ncbi:MAG: hypothetical protein HDR43_02320 [Mycoplasma sp.]|nr:hypothetical protein [Mycoplasma sp.]
MKNSYKNKFYSVPLACTGLGLGIGGLGNTYISLFSLNGIPDAKFISIFNYVFTIMFLLLILFKYVLHPRLLKNDINNALSVSLLPTFSMSLMLVAGFIGMWDRDIDKINPCQISAAIIMSIAILIQFILISFFVRSIIINNFKNKENIYGSYFVPTVGLLTSCTVSNNVLLLPNVFFQIIWYIGYAIFIFSLPIITYIILFKNKSIGVDKYPTIAIWFAPANLSCAGFLHTFLLASNRNTSFYPSLFLNSIAVITTMIGFATTILLYFFIFRVFIYRWKNNNKNFSPILCSLSFPCAIGVTSILFAARALKAIESQSSLFISDLVWIFGVIAIVFCIITTLVLLYLLINMLIHLYRLFFLKNNQ